MSASTLLVKRHFGPNRKFVCCLCEKEDTGYGNNPSPLKFEGECCDECNKDVIEERRMDHFFASEIESAPSMALDYKEELYDYIMFRVFGYEFHKKFKSKSVINRIIFTDEQGRWPCLDSNTIQGEALFCALWMTQTENNMACGMRFMHSHEPEVTFSNGKIWDKPVAGRHSSNQLFHYLYSVKNMDNIMPKYVADVLDEILQRFICGYVSKDDNRDYEKLMQNLLDKVFAWCAECIKLNSFVLNEQPGTFHCTVDNFKNTLHTCLVKKRLNLIREDILFDIEVPDEASFMMNLHGLTLQLVATKEKHEKYDADDLSVCTCMVCRPREWLLQF